MLPASYRIVEAAMEHNLRPKRGNREKVIAAVLEFVIDEYSYRPILSDDEKDIIDVKDIQDLIRELKEAVILEEFPPDAL